MRGAMVRKVVRAALVVAALGLAACGREDRAATAGAPGLETDGGGEAPQGCEAVTAIGRELCARAEFAPLVIGLHEAIGGARERLSPAGRKLLSENLSRYIEAQRVACGLDAPGIQAKEAAACLKDALERRLEESRGLIEERGGFVFQEVALFDAQRISADLAQTSGLGEAAPAAMVQDVRFPRIDNPKNVAAIERFNALVAQRPIGRADAPTEQSVEYDIAFASPELVSVRFDNSEYSLGAAHPTSGMRAITVLMANGEPIRPGDVFTGAGWEDFLTERAIADLSEAFKEFGAGPVSEPDVRETVTKPHNWVIGEQGLTLLFSPYSIGPHAFGPQEVTIPWADLAPYVNPRAPAPIGAG